MNKQFHRIVLLLVLQSSCILYALAQNRINGFNFEGPPDPVDSEPFVKMRQVEANFVSIIPFAYGQSGESILKWKDLNWQWWGESAEGLEQCLKLAKSQGLQTMVKPQIWFDHGSFTGHFKLDTDQDWKAFEAEYRNYILHCASLAAKHNSELFCIGTELCTFVEQRPAFWNNLIKEVRIIYKGKITYAANWDSYKECTLWNNVDYIGIDAYFPLSKQKTPVVKSLLIAWEPWFRDIRSLSLAKSKPVLFTEYGYRSIDTCCESPWDSSGGKNVNHEAQDNALNALYQKFWSQDWFAGGFLWKWHANDHRLGQSNDHFSPQNKIALQTVKSWYGKY